MNSHLMSQNQVIRFTVHRLIALDNTTSLLRLCKEDAEFLDQEYIEEQEDV